MRKKSRESKSPNSFNALIALPKGKCANRYSRVTTSSPSVILMIEKVHEVYKYDLAVGQRKRDEYRAVIATPAESIALLALCEAQRNFSNAIGSVQKANQQSREEQVVATSSMTVIKPSKVKLMKGILDDRDWKTKRSYRLGTALSNLTHLPELERWPGTPLSIFNTNRVRVTGTLLARTSSWNGSL